MDLAALTTLDVDDIEVVESDNLETVSTSRGVVTVPGMHHHRAPSCSPVHTHAVGARPDAVPPSCSPVHTHAVGARPDAVPPSCSPVHTHAVGARPDVY